MLLTSLFNQLLSRSDFAVLVKRSDGRPTLSANDPLLEAIERLCKLVTECHNSATPTALLKCSAMNLPVDTVSADADG